MFLEAYVNAMRVEAQQQRQPSAFFVLVKDDAEYARVQQALAPHRVLRAPERGCQHISCLRVTLLNLYVLSSARRIIGTVCSSFTEVAGYVGSAQVLYPDVPAADGGVPPAAAARAAGERSAGTVRPGAVREDEPPSQPSKAVSVAVGDAAGATAGSGPDPPPNEGGAPQPISGPDARLQGHGAAAADAGPHVSIVAACQDRTALLQKAFASWRQAPVRQIVVVDWGSAVPLRRSDIPDPRVNIVRVCAGRSGLGREGGTTG